MRNLGHFRPTSERKTRSADERAQEAGSPEQSEKILPSQPQLRSMAKALDFLHTEGAEGQVHWSNLYQRVGPYRSGLELSDNVRKTVREYVADKIPSIKQNVSSIADFPDDKLLDALSNNYFEEVPQVEGKRSEVLLTTMASVVKRIETVAYKNILERASAEELHMLGLDAETRDLAIQLLDVSSKANPLFIRFLAYAQLSGKPPEDATPFALHVPGDERLHTMAELFPRESDFLSRHMARLAQDWSAWERKPGASEFKAYLETLAQMYAEKDPAVAATLHKTLVERSSAAAVSGFPIILTSATDSTQKEPYLDPELRVSFVTEDSTRELASFKKAQEYMAASTEALGIGRFAHAMRNAPMVSAIAVGSYGVNLTFNGVAQESPVVLLYLNEQIRQYDKPYVTFMRTHVENTDEVFGTTEADEARLRRMSRMNTMLHESGHSAYKEDSPEAKRLGRKPHTTINELKADILYRAMLPSIIEKEGVEGTKREWALSSLGSALQYLKDQPKDDPYFLSGMYLLNAVLKNGALALHEDTARIVDEDRYFEAAHKAATDLIALYQNTETTERKASQFIHEHCAVSEEADAFIRHLKEG